MRQTPFIVSFFSDVKKKQMWERGLNWTLFIVSFFSYVKTKVSYLSLLYDIDPNCDFSMRYYFHYFVISFLAFLCFCYYKLNTKRSAAKQHAADFKTGMLEVWNCGHYP